MIVHNLLHGGEVGIAICVGLDESIPPILRKQRRGFIDVIHAENTAVVVRGRSVIEEGAEVERAGNTQIGAREVTIGRVAVEIDPPSIRRGIRPYNSTEQGSCKLLVEAKVYLDGGLEIGHCDVLAVAVEKAVVGQYVEGGTGAAFVDLILGWSIIANLKNFGWGFGRRRRQ